VCGAQERESTKRSCTRCVAAVACRIPLPLQLRPSQLRSNDSGHFIAFRLYQFLVRFGVVQGVLEGKRERLGKFGAQGQGPVPNHWKRSDLRERQKQLLRWRTMYGQPPSEDEPLSDEGVYAGLNQFFLSDAGRDA
jgi:hypothetical protein